MIVKRINKAKGAIKNGVILPYAGGLAIIASALKEIPESRSGSLHAGNKE